MFSTDVCSPVRDCKLTYKVICYPTKAIAIYVLLQLHIIWYATAKHRTT